MRDIKFRAWNRIVHRMQEFTLQEIEAQSGKIQWHNLDITQYTGKTDESGNELYEGDLVAIAMDRLGESYPNFQENDYCICEIIFESGGFHAINSEKEYQFPLWAVDKSAITRMGNRWENPELFTPVRL